MRQRYKSKWAHKKETKEQREKRQEEEKKARESTKRKFGENAKAELLKVVQQCPSQDPKEMEAFFVGIADMSACLY